MTNRQSFSRVYVRLAIFLMVAVVLGIVARWWRTSSVAQDDPRQLSSYLLQQPDRARVQLVTSDGRELTVEVVNSSESIIQGLSGRSEIGADGMLFVFPQPHKPTFWMKDMQFDLDLVWLRDGEVIEVTSAVPAPATPESALPLYSPQNQQINMVLEVRAGDAATFGLQQGQVVKHSE
jgi:uncharacterized membrane protein (UPF0127 family)